MTGLLLMTHGSLSKAILHAAELIAGTQENVKVLTLEIADDVDVLLEEVRASLKEMDQGQGVLILIDFFGGTPANVSGRLLMETEGVECLTGLNAPMLLEALEAREEMGLHDLVKHCMEAGQESIFSLREKILEAMEEED